MVSSGYRRTANGSSRRDRPSTVLLQRRRGEQRLAPIGRHLEAGVRNGNPTSAVRSACCRRRPRRPAPASATALGSCARLRARPPWPSAALRSRRRTPAAPRPARAAERFQRARLIFLQFHRSRRASPVTPPGPTARRRPLGMSTPGFRTLQLKNILYRLAKELVPSRHLRLQFLQTGHSIN